jgi:hypothetical protein
MKLPVCRFSRFSQMRAEVKDKQGRRRDHSRAVDPPYA